MVSPGQSGGSDRSLRISESLCFRNKEMSCSMSGWGISWRSKCWWSPAMSLKPSRMGNSGRLVRKNFRCTELDICNCGKSWRIGCSLVQLQTTKRLKEHFIKLLLECLSEIWGSSSIAFLILGISWGILVTNWAASVGKSFFAFPRFSSPLLKKKLAPSNFFSFNWPATVRDTVDFPVPAIPFNQNIHLAWGDVAHSSTWRRDWTLVPGRHSACLFS